MSIAGLPASVQALLASAETVSTRPPFWMEIFLPQRSSSEGDALWVPGRHHHHVACLHVRRRVRNLQTVVGDEQPDHTMSQRPAVMS